MSNEYEKIFPYRFKAYKTAIGRSSFLETNEDDGIPDEYKNEDHISVWCHSCNCYMEYHNDLGGRLDGYYVCPYCKKRVREETPYRQLGREINEMDRREQRALEKMYEEYDNDWD